MITIEQNVSLAEHSTMRLGGKAAYAVLITSEPDLLEAIAFAEGQNLPYRMIGKGSNIIWSGDFAGVLLVNTIKGIQIADTTVTVGAGEVWDTVVEATVEAGLSGLECLSLIPGTAGATPVQNVGAYGAEIQDMLTLVRAYDVHAKEFTELSASECNFSYRQSRFNTTDAGRFLITQLVFTLSHTTLKPPLYTALQTYVDAQGIQDYSPQIIREAVIAIRQSKLPDPAVIPNCGSFFRNPIVPQNVYNTLQHQYPTIPGWPQSDGVKIPAAWLLEQAGFKDYFDEKTGMATYAKQPLVVINQSAKTATDLREFTQHLVLGVEQKFGITLEQEPELI